MTRRRRTPDVESAQVILRAKDGRSMPPAGVTAETIAAYLPSTEAVEEVTRFFRTAGFDVGVVVGNNFSITAPTDTFERTLDCAIGKQTESEDAPDAASEDRDLIPADALPAPIRALIEAVTFTPPPDFGPADFHA